MHGYKQYTLQYTLHFPGEQFSMTFEYKGNHKQKPYSAGN